MSQPKKNEEHYACIRVELFRAYRTRVFELNYFVHIRLGYGVLPQNNPCRYQIELITNTIYNLTFTRPDYFSDSPSSTWFYHSSFHWLHEMQQHLVFLFLKQIEVVISPVRIIKLIHSDFDAGFECFRFRVFRQ